MKTLGLSIALMLFTSIGFSQVFKFETENVCFREKTDAGTWTNWSDWKELNMSLHIDFDNDKVIIFLDNKVIFNISEYKPEEIDADGDSTHEFVCTDNDGVKCRIRLMILKSDNDRIQLYIDYPNYMFAYNLKLLG